MDVEENSLKSVFEALDTADQGFISVEQFISSFQNFENSKELSDSFDAENFRNLTGKSSKLQLWIDTLDPQNNGKIYFNDFVSGIQRLQEDVPYESNKESETQHRLPFLTEEDSFSNDDSGIQIGEPYNPFDFVSKQSTTSDQFPNVFSPFDTTESVADIDCRNRDHLSPGSIHRRVGRFTQNNSDPSYPSNDPSENNTLTRGGEIRSTWPKRQRERRASSIACMLLGGAQIPSAQSQARALSSRGNSIHGSLSNSLHGSHSDIFDDLDNNFDIMQDQYKRLEKKMTEIHSHQLEGESRESKLREDNQFLINRLNVLEDFLRESHDTNVQSLEQEKRQLQDKLNRLDRDNQEEIYRLNQKSILLEAEACTLQTEAAKFKAETEKVKLELVKAQDRVSNADFRIEAFKEDMVHQQNTHTKELDNLRLEKERAEELVDNLTRQLGELRPQSDVTGHDSMTSPGGAEGLPGRCREAEDLVGRITRENKSLREQLEEAQAELFTRSIEEGRSLMRKTEVSLASEIDSYSKDQVMDLLVKEKEANFKLREYIESIIIRIIDKHPSILEIG